MRAKRARDIIINKYGGESEEIRRYSKDRASEMGIEIRKDYWRKTTISDSDGIKESWVRELSNMLTN